MDDRRLPEPPVALPARRLREREVDLHLRAAVAEAATKLRVAVDEPAVELRRRHVRDHGPRRSDLLAVGGAHAHRLPVADDHPLDVAAGFARAPAVLDRAHEPPVEPRPATAWNRHPALLHRDTDHLGHEPEARVVGPEAG